MTEVFHSNLHPQIPFSSSSTPPVNSPNDSSIVVIGFAGSNPMATDSNEISTHILNNLIDANVFNSNAKEFDSFLGNNNQSNNITYYHDTQKGMLFLHLSCSSSSSLSLSLSSDELEQLEFDRLRALLFMFSVCHVIVFLHEGINFDMEIVKKLRMLQAAKHAFTPFIQNMSRQQTNKKPLLSSVSTNMTTTSRSGSSVRTTNRPSLATYSSSSSISRVSSTSSRPSALLGQCAPVLLFLLYDDNFSDDNSSHSTDENMKEPNQPINSTGDNSIKGSSGPMVMLARPPVSSSHRTDGSFKKKLQVSLDAQIRFLVKRCRLVVGGSKSENSSRGFSSSSVVNAVPLFSLDVSRVVALVDRSLCQRGQPLDFIIKNMEEFANSDMLMFANQNANQNNNNEDIQVIKDFIYRQSDILRGRGGLPNNSSSVGGVGMVAAAAAAAAASTSASAKSANAPELPSLENWLSFSKLIIDALFIVEHSQLSGNELIQNEQNATLRLGNSASLEAALSCLENSVNLNKNFSISWCRTALPAAKEVYTKDLPPCYPSTLHISQLEKALDTFRSMVNGPAVQMFIKKLEDECTEIWTSGRQLCDAISLTGNPCIHQRHNTVEKSHSSGYFFLHACACGRSRRLWDDPFDFNTISVDFDCEKDLPNLVLPKRSSASLPFHANWRLLRIGGSRYYKASKGLLQVGFCSRENFLLKWTISIETKNEAQALAIDDSSAVNSTPEPNGVSTVLDEEMKRFDINNTSSKEMVSSSEANISFGKGLPSFTMKKPFSEVVAGTSLVDSTLPILGHNNNQHKVPPPFNGGSQTDGQVHKANNNHQASQKSEVIKIHEILPRSITTHQANSNPFIQIGSNLVPMDSGKALTNSSRIKKIVVYVGFEHECSHGHRFLLTPNHLMELDSSFPIESSEKGHVGSSSIMHEETLDGGYWAYSLLNRNIPLYMNCPHCKRFPKQHHQEIKFASTVSQLQRIFLVTPPFPTVLATCPVIQFETKYLAQFTPVPDKKLTFSLDSRVILPPESFLTIRLPFVYGVKMTDGTIQALSHLNNQPELSAWLVKCTTLQVISMGHKTDQKLHKQ